MSLVEILVGVLIGLIGIVVIFQVLSVSENRKRTTVQGSDAQSAGRDRAVLDAAGRAARRLRLRRRPLEADRLPGPGVRQGRHDAGAGDPAAAQLHVPAVSGRDRAGRGRRTRHHPRAVGELEPGRHQPGLRRRFRELVRRRADEGDAAAGAPGSTTATSCS